MPRQKPGKSEQVVCTPPEFLRSVCSFLEIESFTVDLAATKENSVTGPRGAYITPERDSLRQRWSIYNGWAWLNPPFADIEPWVRKAAEEKYCLPNYSGIAVLVPASTNSQWWAKYVDGYADVRFPTGRLTFVGHTASYPKDLALLLYSLTRRPDYNVWNWRNE